MIRETSLEMLSHLMDVDRDSIQLLFHAMVCTFTIHVSTFLHMTSRDHAVIDLKSLLLSRTRDSHQHYRLLIRGSD